MVTKAGREIAELLGETRRLHRQVAKMVQVAQGLMVPHGYERLMNLNPIVTKENIGEPDLWAPPEVYCWFRNPGGDPNVLACVAAMLFMPPDEAFETSLEEPIVTASWFLYPRPPKIDSSVATRQARWHCYFPARESDGTWYSTTIEDVAPRYLQRWGYSFSRARTFAVPLSEITDSEALSARVVTPLLDDLNAPRP